MKRIDETSDNQRKRADNLELGLKIGTSNACNRLPDGVKPARVR